VKSSAGPPRSKNLPRDLDERIPGTTETIGTEAAKQVEVPLEVVEVTG
jgi:hypothetical protein